MKLTLLCSIFLLFTHLSICQVSISTSGGNALASGSVNYSVGQMLVLNNVAKDGSITHGVQQSIEIFTLSNLDVKTINLKATTYPNPTKDKITLSLLENQLTELSYSIYDVNGRRVKNGNLKNKKTSIKMKQFASGVYFLKVHKNTKHLKIFKIVKN